jgi:hypothetical protein
MICSLVRTELLKSVGALNFRKSHLYVFQSLGKSEKNSQSAKHQSLFFEKLSKMKFKTETVVEWMTLWEPHLSRYEENHTFN